MSGWGEIEDYPKLDFSAISTGTDRYTVRCETERESQWLLAAMKQQYPKQCATWDFPHAYWCRRRNGSYLDMHPRLNEQGCLQYSSNGNWSESHGYVVYTFNELFGTKDLGEIKAGDSDLESLFLL